MSRGLVLALLLCVQWCAPEVREGLVAGRTEATVESDVYMLGGFLYELLTSGLAPFHWLQSNSQLLKDRLLCSSVVPVPGTSPAPGLLGKNVLEAARIDKVALPWCVATPRSGSAERLEELKRLLSRCLVSDKSTRPKLAEIMLLVTRLLAEEDADTEARLTEAHAEGGAPVGSEARYVAGPPVLISHPRLSFVDT